jgi:hypothetical protein
LTPFVVGEDGGGDENQNEDAEEHGVKRTTERDAIVQCDDGGRALPSDSASRFLLSDL